MIEDAEGFVSLEFWKKLKKSQRKLLKKVTLLQTLTYEESNKKLF